MDWEGLIAKAWWPVLIVALAAVPLGLWYIGLGPMAIVAAVPIVAWVGARLLIKGGGEAFTWMSRMPLMKWQGNYYAFNNYQVRVLEDEGELWFVAKDVLAAIELKKHPRVETFLATYPDDARMLTGYRLVALSPAGLDKLLGNSTHHESIRFLQWVHREVLKPWERKRERARLSGD